MKEMNAVSKPLMERRNFFVPPALFARLQAKARVTGTPMSEHVRAALEAYLPKE